VPATVIVGAQWGDEGKGKIVDLLAQHADVVCRYQGGPNAGHTIIVDGETSSSGRCRRGSSTGKQCVIGAGCVVDPEVLIEELDDLAREGSRPRDSSTSRATPHLILPWHVAIDQASERRLGKLQIGTTARGDRADVRGQGCRLGIRVQDLLDAKILREKIEVALARRTSGSSACTESSRSSSSEVASRLERFAQRLRPYVADTSLLVDRALRRRSVRPLRGRAGDAARPRPRHVSVRHPRRIRSRGTRRRHGDRADADRRGRGRLEGVRHAGRRGAVSDGDRGARPGARARARRRVRDGHGARAAAAAGSISSRSATPCA
jgi:adenylosuccinate synthase